MKRVPRLPERIESPSDILEFFGYLTLVDRTAFHPDESFWNEDEERVGYVNERGEPAYTPEEARLREALMEESFRVAQEEGLDIYELGLWATTGELSDAPAWVRETVGSWREAGFEPSMNGRKRRKKTYDAWSRKKHFWLVSWTDAAWSKNYHAEMTNAEAEKIYDLLANAPKKYGIKDIDVKAIYKGAALTYKELNRDLTEMYGP